MIEELDKQRRRDIGRDAMAAGAQGVCARRPPTTARSRITSARSTNGQRQPLGETFSLSLPTRAELRYGENPHQAGALYGDFLEIAEQLHGRELSFNNVFDISSAINLMLDFADYSDAVVAILKHNTPCGVGVGATLLKRRGTRPSRPIPTRPSAG